MDERKQYVPTAMGTYPADHNTVGIKQESIVREASNKKTNYKNVADIPVETSEALTNIEINTNNTDHY